MSGGLSWISLALSTLRPVTSPHLSALGLEFTGSSLDSNPIDTWVKSTGNDLRRISEEVARIERDFEGAVKFTVIRDSTFSAVLNGLQVSYHSRSG